MQHYARVLDGKVVEYPVTHTQIVFRGHPLNWYSPCVIHPDTTKPNQAQEVTTELVVAEDNTVNVLFKAVEKDLATLLATVYYQSDTPKKMKDIDIVLREAIISKMRGHLTTFISNTKDYNLLTWQRAVVNKGWDYLVDLVNNKEPVPLNVSEWVLSWPKQEG